MTGERGAFITVEGGDGAGKTTHIDFIQRWLSERGAKVTRTREPGGTALGERLREILLGADGEGENNTRALTISPRSELLLVFAARAQHLDEVITPALDAGHCVLCDRFTDATYAYQGGGRGIEFSAIETLEQLVQGELRPDLTVLLDVSVEVGLTRTRGRERNKNENENGGQPNDRFERQNRDFKDAVRRVYRERAEDSVRRGGDGRIQTVNADRDIPQVRADLEAVLEKFWQGRES